jgi:hypothetical protein
MAHQAGDDRHTDAEFHLCGVRARAVQWFAIQWHHEQVETSLQVTHIDLRWCHQESPAVFQHEDDAAIVVGIQLAWGFGSRH